jgi:hypothetical protein
MQTFTQQLFEEIFNYELTANEIHYIITNNLPNRCFLTVPETIQMVIELLKTYREENAITDENVAYLQKIIDATPEAMIPIGYTQYWKIRDREIKEGIQIHEYITLKPKMDNPEERLKQVKNKHMAIRTTKTTGFSSLTYYCLLCITDVTYLEGPPVCCLRCAATICWSCFKKAPDDFDKCVICKIPNTFTRMSEPFQKQFTAQLEQQIRKEFVPSESSSQIASLKMDLLHKQCEISKLKQQLEQLTKASEQSETKLSKPHQVARITAGTSPQKNPLHQNNFQTNFSSPILGKKTTRNQPPPIRTKKAARKLFQTDSETSQDSD